MARQLEMARPQTPASERWPDGKIAAVRVVDHGCPSRKCIRPVNHPGECWPKD